MRPGRRGVGGARALAGAVLVGVLIAGGALSGCASLFNLPQSIPAPEADFPSYDRQEPKWVSCGNGAVCADVFAPLDWSDPDGERITLRLAKHPASSGHPIGTLFVNTGGPGVPTAEDVRDHVSGLTSDRIRAQYDVIGWDPRGVGRSSAVKCLDDAGLDEFLYGTGDPKADGAFLKVGSDEWIRSGLDSSAEFGAACEKQTGALLAHVDTRSTVRDLDMLRGIVGDTGLNYLGYSYGTKIGAIYADTYPERAGRLVLDGAMDPAVDGNEVARQQAVGIEGALRAYVADCLSRSDCPLSGTVAQGMGQIAALLAKAEADPVKGSDGRMLYDSTLFTAIVAPLYARWLWPELDTLIEEVAKGRTDQAFKLADQYNGRVDGTYTSNLMEAFAAINCVDYPRPEFDFAAMRAEAAETIRLAPITGRYQTFGDLSCAKWPVPAVDSTGPVTGAGAAPILVIGTTGDPATPYKWAESLAKQLESGVLVTYDGEGHTAYGTSSCVTDIVDDFLLRGTVPGAAAARCKD